MSLIITNIKNNSAIAAKTWGIIHPGVITFGDYEISYDDFCEVVKYFLTNDDLSKKDPRTLLMRELSQYHEINGHMPGKKSIGTTEMENHHLAVQDVMNEFDDL